MIIPYNPSDSEAFYEEYYRQQEGNGLSVYSGKRIMDGAGFGSFFGGLAKKLGRHALNSAKNVAEDMMNGGDLKSSAMRGLKSFGSDALGDVFQSVSGKGRAPKRKRKAPKGKVGERRKRQKGGSIFE